MNQVWITRAESPGEADIIKLRFALMEALKYHISKSAMNQSQAAKLLGVTQPRVSDLMRGKVNLFKLDALVNMATAAGLHVEMKIFKPIQ